MNNDYINNMNGEEICYVNRNKVDMYLMTNQKYFPADKIMYLKEKLCNLTEDQFAMVSCIELKDPTTLLLISLFLGGLGVDRFMLNDTGMGVLKLLTGGVCGVLTIVDWFNVQKKTREMNFNNVMMRL